ncbi:ketol-acid reductoisomerase [Kangiella shandongensis]|uniref:ketol-acid reductoisomerase n=1 Tax=Kangiella shandongensis TaxID=2763258 RepID=UPI001CBEC705|nr:ketol-acid reductoisomerase [Kangiella shandongensis]
MKVTYDNDIKTEVLNDKKIVILGYGSQGYAHSNNLKDSDFDVTVGLRQGSGSFEKLRRSNMPGAAIEEALQDADLVMMLLPDEHQPTVYEQYVKPNLKAGASLGFAHGFNVHFEQINPRDDINVFMVAPKGPGHTVRSTYTEGSGVPCLVAIHQDVTGDTKQQAYAYASAIGGGRAGIIETTFKEETETDLFGEQAVLCGGTAALVQAGFETLVEAGYAPEMAYFECLHELKLIVDLMYEGGINTMRYSISNTAEYGDLTRGNRLVTKDTKAAMKDILQEIQNGQFAKEYVDDCRNDYQTLLQLRGAHAQHPIETVGEQLRGMMPWIKKKPLVDQTIN